MLKKFYALLFISLFVSSATYAKLQWEAIVTEGMVFKYLVPTSTPSLSWMQYTFDDGSWKSAPGGFGYGDNDDRTVIPSTTSIYLRKKFNVPAGTKIEQLSLDIDYDDAFVAYLNGVEIARSSNLQSGTPGFSANLTADHEAKLYSGGVPDRFSISPTLLNEGQNILAVHVLNINFNSSDMSARVFLTAEVDATTNIFSPVPEWFKLLVEYDTSTIPILKINTEGQNIVDEPKIMARMQVVNNPSGINNFKDTVYEYDGWIGIEIRGNTAQMFPKKSYTIETRNEDGSNNNVEFLGLPKENDWVLHGPYTDKSLMRNALAYHIGSRMGKWNPRNRFVEVVINGEYRGVYLAVEKIKIDKNRVDIASLKPEDIEGDQLTGGYIMSIDRNQEGSFNSPYIGRTGTYPVTFSYVDPKFDELNDAQRKYIRDYIFAFEDALKAETFADPEIGYRNYIDVGSFIDYFIITELSKDIDGYRVSVFFHKDKDSKGGKLTMSPFWDYNLCFGNANFYGGGITDGWTSDPKPNGIGEGDQGNEIPFWWERFQEDPYFQTALKYRWEHLRQGVLHKDSINFFIDSCKNVLSDASVRNFDKFNILNSYVWPNPFVGGTYAIELLYLKTWLGNRIDWLDAQIETIEESFPNSGEDIIAPDALVNVYPNPFTDRLNVSFKTKMAGNASLVIRNILGQQVYAESIATNVGLNQIELNSSKIGTKDKVLIYTLMLDENVISTGKMLRK